MIQRYTLFSSVYFRLAFFAIAVLFFVIWTAVFFVSTDFHQETVVFNLVFALYLVAVSGFIEMNRPGNHFFLFGLDFDMTTLPNLIIALILNASVLIFFIICGLFLYEIRIGNFNTAVLNIAMMHLFVSMSEEILVRGIIFQAIAEKYGYVISAIVTSSIFSLLHYFNPNVNWLSFINIFLAGLLFSLMLVKTGSLWMPITFHFAWNTGFHAILGLNLSGLKAHDSLFYIENLSLNLFWGNEFGPEGGLLATTFLIFSYMITIKYAKLSPFVTSKLFKRRYIESKLKYERKALNLR